LDKKFILPMLAVALLQRCDLNAQWVQTNGLNHENVPSIVVRGSSIFAAGTDVFRSTDSGANWLKADSGLTNQLGFFASVYTFAFNDTYIFAGSEAGIFRSTNNGSKWTSINRAVEASSFAFIDSALIAGTAFGGLYLSADNGVTWKSIRDDSMYEDVTSMAVLGSQLIVGTDGDGLFLTTDNGTSWLNTHNIHMEPNVKALAVMTNGMQTPSLFVAGRFGFFYSSPDSGNTWTTLQTMEPYEMTSLIVYGSTLFAGTYNAGVLLSTDMGVSWNEINTGLPGTTVLSLAICGSTLYAGTDTSGLWRRPLAEVISDVGNQTEQIPSQFVLEQNYPNPFNPSTTIAFAVPLKARVTLKIFDVMGREVATVVSEEMPAGTYARHWNASNFSSGIYFYRLQTGSVSITKKLILLR